MEIPGWCERSFDDSSWKNVALRNAPGGVLTAHDTPADKVMETFTPISFKKHDDGSYTVDFGEVISGWVHFKGVKGAEGQKLTIKYESEYPKEVSYTFKDSEPIDYTPKFSWQVFRTVTVKGAELTADMLTAEAVYTSMDVDCEFSSSHELFNKINKIWQRTEKDNIHSGVESDCAARQNAASSSRVSCGGRNSSSASSSGCVLALTQTPPAITGRTAGRAYSISGSAASCGK